MTFVKFLKTSFLQNTCGRLLLKNLVILSQELKKFNKVIFLSARRKKMAIVKKNKSSAKAEMK